MKKNNNTAAYVMDMIDLLMGCDIAIKEVSQLKESKILMRQLVESQALEIQYLKARI